LVQFFTIVIVLNVSRTTDDCYIVSRVVLR